MILLNDRDISNLVVTSILGHGGSGNAFPLSLLPSYRKIVRSVRERGIVVIAKSATRHPRKDNHRWWAPWRCVRKIEKGGAVGLVNAYGLSNSGVETCAQEIRRATEQGFRVIPSYSPEFFRNGKKILLRQVLFETQEAIRIYQEILGRSFWALELNGSCPNTGESLSENTNRLRSLVYALIRSLPVPLIFKVSPVHPISLSLELEQIGVSVIHAVNTFPFATFFPDGQISPLARYGGGGCSGKMIFEKALEINLQLRRKLKIPMIMGGGISSCGHLDLYRQTLYREGFTENCLAICSVIRTDPKEAQQMISFLD